MEPLWLDINVTDSTMITEFIKWKVYYWLDNHGFFIIEEIQHFLSNLWDKLHCHVFQGDNRWDGIFPQEGATSVANGMLASIYIFVVCCHLIQNFIQKWWISTISEGDVTRKRCRLQFMNHMLVSMLSWAQLLN